MQGANQGLEDACELAHHVRAALVGHPAGAAGSAGSGELGACLERFWRARRARVAEIHEGSRARTAEVNKSTATSRRNSLNASIGRIDFSARVYGWKPSAMAEREAAVQAAAEEHSVVEPALP